MGIFTRYIGLIGLGLVYLWIAALLSWSDWARSDVLLVKAVAIAGMVLASAAGTATCLYINQLEGDLKKENERSTFLESQADEWKGQAQMAISLLEKERRSSGTA